MASEYVLRNLFHIPHLSAEDMSHNDGARCANMTHRFACRVKVIHSVEREFCKSRWLSDP